jgi:hypothetical protein
MPKVRQAKPAGKKPAKTMPALPVAMNPIDWVEPTDGANVFAMRPLKVRPCYASRCSIIATF